MSLQQQKVPCPVGAASPTTLGPRPPAAASWAACQAVSSFLHQAAGPAAVLPPAAVTVPACKLLAGNKRLRSGRTRGASPPLSRRAARSHAAGWKCSGGGRISSHFQPRHSRCPTRAAPLEARERAARTAREEDGGGAYGEPRWEGRGRRQGLEAKAAREGLLGVGARDSSLSRTPSSSLPPH